MRFWPDLSLDRIESMPRDGLKLPNRLWPFIWFFVRQIKWPFLLAACFFATGNMIFTSESIFFGKIIGGLADAQAAGNADVWPLLMPVIVAYILIVQVGGRLSWQVGHSIEIRVFPLFTMLIRRQLALYLHGHSYRYFQDDFAGRLSGKIVEMPHAMHMVMKGLLNPFLFTIINLGFASILLVSVDWRYGICALLFASAYISQLAYFVPRIQARAQKAADARHGMRGQFVDTVANVLLVKLFARIEFEDGRFTHAVKNAGSAEIDENRNVYVFYRIQHLICGLFQSSIIAISVWGWRQGALDVQDVATAIPLSLQVVGNCWWLLETSADFLSRLGEVKSGIESIVVTQEVTDKPGAQSLKVTRGAIDFKNITFSYPSRPIFEGFTLHVPAGQRVGLVGPSGAGKSTLMQLLMRLHDVQDGEILVDGQNITDVSQESLRSSMAIIPQSSELLHRTVRENIAYGRLDATDNDIIAAAQKAQAHDFIVSLKDKQDRAGYDATVGERGVKLSGGQRQRIAIARAILKNAPILVLDEATSSLDSESELLIQQSLKELMKGRTVLAIAHRLSTIAHLDRLVVMGEGRIVEDGSHDELLARKGLYARLWDLQSGGFLGGAKRREDET